MVSSQTVVQKKDDHITHRYDTSSYIKLNMQVRRDPLTGRLRPKEENSAVKKITEKA